MKRNNQTNLNFSELHHLFYNLSCKIKSIQEYSTNDFNELSKKLKIYFENTRSIAFNTITIKETVENTEHDLDTAEHKLYLVKITENTEKIKETVSVLLKNKKQSTMLKEQIGEELVSFGQLEDKLNFMVYSNRIDVKTDPSLSTIASVLKNQIRFLKKIESSITKLSKSIHNSSNALFSFASSLEFIKDSDVAEVKTFNTILEPVPVILEKAERCLEDINKLTTNIQYQDLIRQRLEHIDIVYEKLIAELNKKDVTENSYRFLPLIPEFTKLHKAQLELSNEECQDAFSNILIYLTSIYEDVTDISSLCIKFPHLVKHFDIDFLKRTNEVLSKLVATINNNSEKYKQALKDIHFSLIALRIFQNKIIEHIGNCLIVYESDLKQKKQSETNWSNTNLLGLVADCQNTFDKLEREVKKAVQLFDNVEVYLKMVNDLYNHNSEKFDINSTGLLSSLKHIFEANKVHCAAVSEEVNPIIDHLKHSSFYRVVIAELLTDLEQIAELPRAQNVSDEYILQGLAEIEKSYTMHSERVIHYKVFAQKLGLSSEAMEDKIAESIVNEDNLEIF